MGGATDDLELVDVVNADGLTAFVLLLYNEDDVKVDNVIGVVVVVGLTAVAPAVAEFNIVAAAAVPCCVKCIAVVAAFVAETSCEIGEALDFWAAECVSLKIKLN
ncbi:hypothetical protein HELRODRAFT_167390 [Helobdella robusta]|uniref:Uncharacterized protein n=1 Tax=Helobdella robusta TaxID=6412 RepID=T1EZC1_HELRO|nr:hypothetical protein HELRODRAFT_167390 [Helobdella robusta]ESO10879.1 hypothetical protein HELRODRAFT_167390 [Helobdella robusta]